ncbi:MAG TPA: DUF1127 domain-containing protein [Acidocella sp.]|nr:DUF1127 domain-containing protein [Acidocella sp.]
MQSLTGFRPVSLPSLTRGLRHLWASLAQMHRMTEGRRSIAQMDARMLADIGLSRADAGEEVRRKPWDTAPRPR